jgi:hypothetical protein
MNTSVEQDLQRWTDDWQTEPATPVVPEVMRAFVVRRSRQLTAWAAAESGVGAVAVSVLVYLAIAQPDPLDKLAMGLLALIVAGALAFGCWNWRGTLRSSAETTAGFVLLSLERAKRLRRAVRAGWVLLAGEVVVFVPWIMHRLYGGDAQPVASTVMLSWGLLIVLAGSAAAGLVALGRWADRDASWLRAMRDELSG